MPGVVWRFVVRTSIGRLHAQSSPLQVLAKAWYNILAGRCCARDKNLNLKQAAAHLFCAVRIVNLLTESSRTSCAPQLSCLLLGGPGCGKSHLLRLNNLPPHACLSAAYMHSAARLIHGTTLHSLLGLSRDASRPITGQRRELKLAWEPVRLFRIDEASMLSAELLCRVDVALRALRNFPTVPWGNVILDLSGDLRQLPPVRAIGLTDPCTPPPLLADHELNKWKQKHADTLQGQRLWKQIPHCIIGLVLVNWACKTQPGLQATDHGFDGCTICISILNGHYN